MKDSADTEIINDNNDNVGRVLNSVLNLQICTFFLSHPVELASLVLKRHSGLFCVSDPEPVKVWRTGTITAEEWR